MNQPIELHNIPGLSAQRLSELYRGVLHATGDPHAQADVVFLAEGGVRMAIHWIQLGLPMHYETTLTKAQVDAGGREEQTYLDWATEALEAVRKHTLSIEQDPAAPAYERSMAERVRGAVGAFFGFAAKVKIDRLSEEQARKEQP